MEILRLVAIILSWLAIFVIKTFADGSLKDDPLKFAKDLRKSMCLTSLFLTGIKRAIFVIHPLSKPSGKSLSHIKEHLMEQYGFDGDKADKYLKEYDAQTQYFIMHDYDKNRKLDGLELLKSMTHFHDDHEEGYKSETPAGDNTETLVEFVDMILRDQDYNKDGYIDYPEYISYYSKYDNS